MFNRGVAYGELDPPQKENEIVDYTRAIETPEASASLVADAYLVRGETAHKTGNSDRARADWRQALQRYEALDDQEGMIEAQEAIDASGEQLS